MNDSPLTFLFTDLENSTPLWEKFPDEMQRISARHDALLREIIDSQGGRIVKSTGDGFHAVFESPHDGIATASAGQLAIMSEPWPTEIGPLKIRMGLHTGVSQEREGDYYGVEVNKAARIMGIAYGGQILLSEITTRIVENSMPEGWTLIDLGEHRLKGIANIERIFQLSHPDLSSDFPPLKSLSAFKHNLPYQHSTFIGREKELASLKDLLEKNRLVTLLGPGGTGKTRLMLQLAEEIIEDYSSGVWLVELAPLTDPELIVERVSGALGVQEQPDRRPIDTLTEYLRRKELLLLLDNVEHLVKESAELAEHLLYNCPKLKILVTGRESLFIEGEFTLQIPSLTLPAKDRDLSVETIGSSEGVQFFLDRGRSVNPQFNLTEGNVAAVAEIVRRLDGIPLALELAAARLRMLTVEQIALRLNDRFRLLTGGRRTALPRQQTLQALIDWSWNLLDDQERLLLSRLSVFAGGWSLEAAQAVVGFEPLDEFSVFDGLEQLIHKSLVAVEYPLKKEARYRMLESIHQYAQAKLIEGGAVETLRERHTDYFVALVEEFGDHGMGPDFYTWQERLAVEGDNLRAVRDWISEERPGLYLHFAGILHQFEAGWMPYSEARSWLENAVTRARKLLESGSSDINRIDFARALQAFGWLLVLHGDMVKGHAFLDESISLSIELGNFQIRTSALSMKAQAMGGSVTQDVIQQLEEAIAISRRDGYEIELLFLLYALGQAYLAKKDLEKGKKIFDEVIGLLEYFDFPFMEYWMVVGQANVALAFQETARAEEFLLRAIEINEKLGDQRFEATNLSMLAHIYRREGRLDEALALYRKTIQAWQEQGHQSAVAHQLECFAYIAIAHHDYVRAAQLLGAAQKARERLDAFSTELQEIEDFETAMSRLRKELEADELGRMLQNGGLLSLDEAVLLALNET